MAVKAFTADVVEELEKLVIDSISEGTWYGSGGWLPSIRIMNEWRKKTKDITYQELKASECKDFIELSQHKAVILNKTLTESKIDNDLQSLSLLKEFEVMDPIEHLYSLMLQEPYNQLVLTMLEEVKGLPMPLEERQNFDGLLQTPEDIIGILSKIIETGPQFFTGKDGNAHLVGVPMAALFTNVNATNAGQALFKLKKWNDALYRVMDKWKKTVLDTSISFPLGNGWITETGQHMWNRGFDGKPITTGPTGSIWVFPKQEPPYWDSWNLFFTRDIHPNARPISSPGDNSIITSSNDGQEFRWRTNIQKNDTFWLKNMEYSLSDIFKGLITTDKISVDDIVHRFEGGMIFQTFLNPYNYHQWWSPVTGNIVGTVPQVLNGFCFSKTILPDIDGATTASCPYLLEVNARGILIIDTTGYANIGWVCCVPIGMVEVSCIKFRDNVMEIGSPVRKGQNIGSFYFGGYDSSSFAIIFENPDKYNKYITFESDRKVYQGSNKFPSDAPPPGVTGGGIDIDVGMQIAKIWYGNAQN